MTNTPKTRQQWILDLLKSEPSLSYGETWAKYRLNWAKGKTTFDKDWKTVQEQLKDYQIQLQKEKERVSIAIETEAVKQGLKTKTERLMILQNQVNDIVVRLEKGTHQQEAFRDGKVITYERNLTPSEVSSYNRTIKELQSEISKIEGDYAPTKQDVSINAFEDLLKTLPDE